MYIQHFGLTEKPFNVTPDPRFLYLSPSHQEALASMIYGIKERRGFISVIGEIGTGKTTLLHTLFKELGTDVKTVFIFNTKINFMQLLHNILIELELTPASNNKALLLNQLNDYLVERLSFNENVALIIDEAQNLSPDVLEELRMLSNLETPREKLLQIVLVGQPELDFKLRSPGLRQLKQRIGINCYLTPLNHEEQMKYIMHRLSIAGCDNNTIFSPGALKLIFKHSKGIPRIINIFCDNALLTAYGRQLQRIDIDTVREVIADFEQSKMLQPEKIVGSDRREAQEKKRSFAKIILNSILVLFIILLALLFGLNYRYISAMFPRFASLGVSKLETLLNRNDRTGYSAQRTESIDQFPETPASENNILSVNNAVAPLRKTDPDTVDLKAENETTVDVVPASESSPAAEPLIQNNSIPEEPRKIVTAKKGDMVSTIALKEYGTLNDTIFDVIKRTNPDLEDLNIIYVGQSISLPALAYENLIVKEDNDTYSLHVATFSSYREAEKFVATLLVKDYSPLITPVAIAGNQPWYRVTVGNFTNRSEAIDFAGNFKAYDLPSSVLKE